MDELKKLELDKENKERELKLIEAKISRIKTLSKAPDVNGKYLKSNEIACCTHYIHVNRVEKTFTNDYVAIGDGIIVTLQLIATNYTIKTNDIFSLRQEAYDEISKEEYLKVLDDAYKHIKNHL